MGDVLFILFILLLSITSALVRYVRCMEKVKPGFIMSSEGLPFVAWAILFPLGTYIYEVKKEGLAIGSVFFILFLFLYFTLRYIFVKRDSVPDGTSKEEIINNYIFRDWWIKMIRRRGR